MVINNDTLFPFIIFNQEFKYNEHITLYPVTMRDYITFKLFSPSITLRKNSIFREKKIIKMTYLDFLFYCLAHQEIEQQYEIPELSKYYIYAIQLLRLCCKDAEISISDTNGQIFINNELVTPKIFDDLRRIIIIQNGIDFNIDEFLNHDTEKRLQKAQDNLSKDNNTANIEDYIDSLVIAINITEDTVMNMSIRKFWRYIKRYQLHEDYTIAKTGECSGMVSFKEPIKHWITSLDEDDRFKHLKTDENKLRGKIS